MARRKITETKDFKLVYDNVWEDYMVIPKDTTLTNLERTDMTSHHYDDRQSALDTMEYCQKSYDNHSKDYAMVTYHN